MNFWFTIREGFKGFRRAKLATILTITSIAFSHLLIGIFIVFSINVDFLISDIRSQIEFEVFLEPELSNARAKLIEKNIRQLDGVDTVIYISKEQAALRFEKEFGKKVEEILTVNPLPSSCIVYMKEEFRNLKAIESISEKVKQIEGIDAITHHTYLSSISGLCCDIVPTRIVAFNPATDFIINPWLQKSLGRPLQLGEAIAGFGTSENLGLGLLDIEATIFDNRFKIVGELEKTGTGLDHALFMTEDNLQNIIESGKSPLKRGNISIIFTKVKKGFDPDFVGRVLEGEIPEVDVVARSQMGEKFLNTLADINKIFLLTTFLASVLTTFLVWAIFSAIANERSKEIGIMRALGAKESHIVHLYLLEVTVLGLLGSTLGVIAGTYLSALLAGSFSLLKNISAGLTGGQQAIIALLGLLIGVGICITGAMMPINRIKKLEPLLVIKEE